jgi:hypothetical protein
MARFVRLRKGFRLRIGCEAGVAPHRAMEEDAPMHVRLARSGASLVLSALIVASTAVACDPAPAVTPTTSSVATHLPSAALQPSPSRAPSPIPLPTMESLAPGATPLAFPFSADAILGYYESQGYVCAGATPSTEAAGYSFRRCELTDGDGRMRVVGVVTDPNGDLADGFASIEGTAAETILDPVVALEPLSGFLGAMLGERQGESQLAWLAGHLGDTYATTKVGDVTIATYTESADDHSKIYLEVANQAYLDAPRPTAATP